MQVLKIGEYLSGEPEVFKEGLYFEIMEDSMLFTLFFSDPSEDEIERFKYGKLDVGIAKVEDMLFLMLKIGIWSWMDCPYSIHLEKKRPSLARPMEGQGFGVLLMMVDSMDGKIRAFRLISLSNSFSNELAEAIEAQPAVKNYNIKLASIYERFDTSEDLLPYAKFQ